MTPPWISGPVVDSVASHSRARPQGDANALPWRPASRCSPTRASSIARRGGDMTDSTISIVAIGGSTRPDSSSERAVRLAARGARDAGAHVTTITGRELMLPIYDTETSDRTPQALALVEAVRGAHGLLVASPQLPRRGQRHDEERVGLHRRSCIARSPVPTRSRRRLYCRRLRLASDCLDAAAVATNHPRSAGLANTTRCHHQRRRYPFRPKMGRLRMPPPPNICARSVNRWSNSRLCARR